MKPVVEDTITAVLGTALGIVVWCILIAALGLALRVNYELFMLGWEFMK